MPPPQPVVIGVIDDGIAFAHARFRQGMQTRVAKWWLQDGRYDGNSWGTGKIMDAGAINALLGACTYDGVVDEEMFYARAGLINFRDHDYGHMTAAWRAAHGTHVMDLACGFDPPPPPGARPIVAVQLPVRTTADTSGGDLFWKVVPALDFIAACAEEIGPDLPLVINLSYGIIAGPHDGTSDLEHAIDEFIARRKGPTRVLLPAGNSYLARCHARVSFNTANLVRLPWRVLPDDHTPSYVEIWMPWRDPSNASRLQVRVIPPGGSSPSTWLGEVPGSTYGWGTDPNYHAWIRYNHMSPPTDRGRFKIYLNATASLDPALRLAPAGEWTIELQRTGLAPLHAVHAWIQRDESLYGYPLRGRQSYFDHPDYKRFDDAGRDVEVDKVASCPVRRRRTINAIATGASPIVVGGFLRKERDASKYTAAGPIAAARPGPQAVLPSDDSRAHRGVLAAGSRSGSAVAMWGTSVAAPTLARRIAGQLAASAPSNQAYVTGQAGTSPLPDPRRGAGRINAPPLNPLPRP